MLSEKRRVNCRSLVSFDIKLYRAVTVLTPCECVPCGFGQLKISRQASDSSKVCDRVKFIVLLAIYGGQEMIRLLDLNYLILML